MIFAASAEWASQRVLDDFCNGRFKQQATSSKWLFWDE